MIYVRKVQLLKTGAGERLWRRWRAWRGGTVSRIDALPGYIAEHAPRAKLRRRWLHVGSERVVLLPRRGGGSDCHQRRGRLRSDARVRSSVGVERESRVEFILGDISQPSTIARVGVCDVVFCAGVLYHHPSPFDLLVALRRICGSLLILRTATIPEVRGLPARGGVLPAASSRSAEALDARPHDRVARSA